VIRDQTGRILCVHISEGKCHDYKLLKQSGLAIKPTTPVHADLGYKGLEKEHNQEEIPHKKSKHHPLTKEQKNENRAKSSIRIAIEHVNAKLKVFQILTQKYRNQRKRFSLRFSFICGLVNFEQGFIRGVS
jgi:IS5 family transposase